MATAFKSVLVNPKKSSKGSFIIEVTCGESLAGNTISITDGTTTLSKLCSTTSPYLVEFPIPHGGSWTPSVVIGGETLSDDPIVVPYQFTFDPRPVGRTATPTGVVRTWLRCAEIKDKDYTTISQVLADTTTFNALISNSNAMDYMVRSTTWTSAVTSNSSAMSSIGSKNACADQLLGDSTWRTAICNSSYFTSVLNVKVPVMTSATTPSGTVTCSNEDTQYNNNGWKVFDGSTVGMQNRWQTEGGYNKNQWVCYQFTKNVKIYKATITNINQSGNPKNCKIQYSTNGTSFSDARSFTATEGSLNTNTTSTAVVSTVGTGKYWRMLIVDTWNSYASQSIWVGEMQFYGRNA